jgi:4-amino-4-deoxy-L-arabinose transferase-like glycosyltransferase
VNKTKLYYILIIGLGLLGLFGRLNDIHLGHEEPRRALIAQEILLGENIWQPTIKGENYYRKPPLYNWLIAITYKITGSQSEFTTRLPSVISYLLFIFFSYHFFKKLIDKREAKKVALLVFIAGDILLYYSRMAEMDLFYALLSFPVMVLPWWYLKQTKIWHFFIIPPLLAGLGFMSKGLPSLAFIGISSLVAILLTKKYKLFYSPFIIVSLILFSLPSIPYFYMQNEAGTLAESWQTLFGESANRTTGNVDVLNYFKHFLIFPFQVLIAFLPGTLLLFGLKKAHFKSDTSKALLIIFLANILIYWISPGARVRYIYMFFPIVAYFAVTGLKSLKIEESRLFKTSILVFQIIVFTALVGGVIYFNQYEMLSILIIAILIANTTIGLKSNKTFWPSLLVLMLSARAVFDFYSVKEEFLVSDRAWNEKQQAIELHKKYPNKKLYLNALADRYYTFCYEYTKLSEKMIEVDLEFEDKNALYLVREQVDDERFTFIEDFAIGNDSTFKLVQCR